MATPSASAVAPAAIAPGSSGRPAPRRASATSSPKPSAQPNTTRDEDPQVGRDRVARVALDAGDDARRARALARHRDRRVAVDALHVDAQAHRHAHAAEAHAPVDERDVEVERSAVARDR